MIPVKITQLSTNKTPIHLTLDVGWVEKYKTVTGNPIVISDGVKDTLLKKLQMALTPIQDLHGYDKPWVGGAGKNKFNPQPYTGIGYNADIGATVTLTEASATFKNNTISYTIEAWYNRVFRTPKLTQGSYTISMSNISLTSPRVSVYEVSGIDNTIIGKSNYSALPTDWNPTFSITESGNYLVLAIGSNTAQTISFSYPQIELGSAKTTYEPYENLCPISGWDSVETVVSGVNVWDEEWEVGGLAWATGQPVALTDRYRSKNFCGCKPNTAYYGNKSFSIFFYDEEKNFISYNGFYSNVLTTPQNCHYFKITDSSSATYNNDISINYPSTDTDYHPYDGHTYTTDLPQTVYGGTLDVVSGVLTVDRAMVDLGSLTYTRTQYNSQFYYFRAVFPSIAYGTLGQMANMICSAYETVITGTGNLERTGTITNFATNNLVLVRDDRYTDVQSFISAVSGVQLVYELATPTTIQCDPQTVSLLAGENVIMGDGDMEITYRVKASA